MLDTYITYLPGRTTQVLKVSHQGKSMCYISAGGLFAPKDVLASDVGVERLASGEKGSCTGI